MIRLQDEKPFARGGNRLCYVHPQLPGQVVKVRRPQWTLEDLRRKKGFPRNLRPLSSFDESLQEFRLMQQLDARIGERLYEVVSRNYGFVDTDMGQGLCSELIRNADGKISRSVMQYVWENGITPTLEDALARFEQAWIPLPIPTRDILLHNVVAQCDAHGDIVRLVVIDGLGSSGLIPYAWRPRALKMRRARQKLERFKGLMRELAEVRKTGVMPSTFWQLRHDGLPPANDSGSGGA
ncbi:MAG: YrbL family protein [Gammaproteobacteria bacterium]